MLATLAMLILAMVAVATLGMLFFLRPSSRAKVPEDLNIADPAYAPFEASISKTLASDDANNAVEQTRCCPTILVAIPASSDLVGASAAPVAETDKAPTQANVSDPFPHDDPKRTDALGKSVGEQIPLAEEFNPCAPVAVGEVEHGELPSPIEGAAVEATVETFVGSADATGAGGGAPPDQSASDIDSSLFQANTGQPLRTATSEPEAFDAIDDMSEPALSEEVVLPTAAASPDTGLPKISPQDDPTATSFQQRQQRAVHRDRRGRRRNRNKAASPQPEVVPAQSSRAKLSADVRLRLELHPVRETAQLSLVLSKPEGYPSACTINGGTHLHSYDESRYDDIDLMWLPDTLSTEFRFFADGGYTWVRSARRIHIFAGSATEPGFVSVPAAVQGLEHAIICRSDDSDIVRGIAEAAGSPEPKTLVNWEGVPAGWSILTGYTPYRAAEILAAGEFSPLDPRYNLEISFVGGLQLRSNVFAEGHSPRIKLPDLPDRVSVTIDGKIASPDSTGAWQAEGWDAAGIHLIDLVPGPSRSYEIVADPANGEGWARWQSEIALPVQKEVWTQTSICGASILGLAGETVLAHEAKSTVIALGTRGNTTPFQKRSDANVSIALIPEPPAFLLVASGTRRHQGEIVWLGLEPTAKNLVGSSTALLTWANIVRSAAARRLPFQFYGSPDAKAVWQKMLRRARDVRRHMP